MKRKPVLVFFILIFFVSSTITCAAADSGVQESLVLYLTMDLEDSKVIDLSPFGNNGRNSGAVVVKGKLGSGLSFDGKDDYVQVPHTGSLNIHGALTLEAWINPATYENRNRTIVEKRDSANDGYVLLLATNGKLRIKINASYCESITRVSTGEWYHVVGVYDGNYLRIYINGIEESNKEVGTLSIDTSRPLTVGRMSYSADGYFQGVIDEVRIYNRALAADEVERLYDSSLVESGGSFWERPEAMFLLGLLAGVLVGGVLTGSIIYRFKIAPKARRSRLS